MCVCAYLYMYIYIYMLMRPQPFRADTKNQAITQPRTLWLKACCPRVFGSLSQ